MFCEFMDFWTSESNFALSMPRHKKKKSGAATGHTIWWINRILMFSLLLLLLFCSCFHEKGFVH